MADTFHRYKIDDDDPAIPTLTERVDAPLPDAPLPAWLQADIDRAVQDAIAEAMNDATEQLRLRLREDIAAIVTRAWQKESR